MHPFTRLAAGLAIFVSMSAFSAASLAQDDDLRAFDGTWLYVEDLTEGRAREDRQPPMSVTFGLRVEEGAVVMLRGGGREERIAIDGTAIEEVGETATTRRSGSWEDGVLEYDVQTVRHADGALLLRIRREFRVTPDGLRIRVVVGDPATMDSLALYRHPEDIPLPTPARATIADLAWLAGAWTGTQGTSSTEERWSPPKGGAMLGVSRTVRDGSMRAFEYLRVVEQGGGLVYVAQPGGRSPTEFVLTDVGPAHAVFENPRHDSPQRIVYELSGDGILTASIGFIHGGRPTRFEFVRE